MQNRLVERLEKNDVVLCGEGYVFELERRGYLKAGPFVPEVVLDFPDVVKQLHREYMRAGSDIVLALSYYAHRDKLKVIGREADLEEINRVGVRLARDVADEGDALVAGGLCNSWVYDPANAKETGRLVRAMYEEQVRWAVDEGVDLILAETLNHVGEAEIALELIQEAGLPSVINFFPLNEKTGDGFTFGDACKRLSDLGATVVGLNCGRGPATITSFLEDVINSVDTYVGVLPITYRTDASNPNFLTLKHEDCRCGFPIELEPFLLGRYEMADFALQARQLGARFIGVCCGGAPHHVRAMAEALGREVPASRYSPDMSKHAIFGSYEVVYDHEKSRFTDEIEAFHGQ